MADKILQSFRDMTQESFQIAYDGPDMTEHSMDVQQLGPALLSVGDLCREAHRVVNGDDVANVNVRVRANFDEGCFDITFDLIQIFQHVTELIKSDDAADAKQLLEWIGLISGGGATVGGLIGFLKWKKGRQIKDISQQTEADGSTVYNISVEGDDNSVQIDSPVYKLYRSPRVRAAQRGMVAPLKSEGVDTVEIRERGRAVTTLTKDEYQSGAFEFVEEELEAEESEESQYFNAILVLRAPVFVENIKWQFSMGETRISASISDEAFVRRVFREGERFGVGDRLRVRMTLTQMLTPRGTYRNDYDIVEVFQVMRGPRQLGLQMDEGDSQ